METQSPFLILLPTEIRLRIYEETFGRRTLQIHSTDTKEWLWWHSVCIPSQIFPFWDDRIPLRETALHERNKISISILFSCRQV